MRYAQVDKTAKPQAYHGSGPSGDGYVMIGPDWVETDKDLSGWVKARMLEELPDAPAKVAPKVEVKAPVEPKAEEPKAEEPKLIPAVVAEPTAEIHEEKKVEEPEVVVKRHKRR